MGPQYCLCLPDGSWACSEVFDTIEQAKAFRDEQKLLDCTIHVVRYLSPDDYMPNAVDLTEWMDHAAEDQDIVMDDPLHFVPREDRDEATRELREWAMRWVKLEWTRVATDRVEE